MSNLLRMMQKLGADAALSDQYKKNPQAVMDQFKLSDEERKALLDHDYEAVKRLTGLKDGQFSTNTTIIAYDSQ